jgi:hypothetical protein
MIILPGEKKALVVLTNGTAGDPIIRAVFNNTLNRNGGLSLTEKKIDLESDF